MKNVCKYFAIITGLVSILISNAQFATPTVNLPEIPFQQRYQNITYHNCLYNFRIQVWLVQPEERIEPLGWRLRLRTKNMWNGYKAEEILAENYVLKLKEIFSKAPQELLNKSDGPPLEAPLSSRCSWPIENLLFFDENNIPITLLRDFQCLGIDNFVKQGYWYYCFTNPESLPKGMSDIINALYDLAFEKILLNSQTVRERLENQTPVEVAQNGIFNNQKSIAWITNKIAEVEVKLASETDEKEKREVEYELRRLKESILWARASIKQLKEQIAKFEEQYKKIGYFTEAERAQMRAYIEYQETRCARMPFEEAKKDFECRSIQIRDYLRYGPRGAPPEEMQKRASRTLAPEPPRLPWDASSK